MSAVPFALAAFLFAPPAPDAGVSSYSPEPALNPGDEVWNLQFASVKRRAADPAVTLTGAVTTASVRIGDRPSFVWHSAGPPKRNYLPLPKPYLFPLYTPSGVNVLDYASLDHPHHKGAWISVDEVELHAGDGESRGPFKHWVENGRIETEEVQYDSQQATIRVVNRWLSPKGVPLLTEETTIAVSIDEPTGGTLLQYDIQLSPPPGGGTVIIGDTKEGFLGIRMAPQLDVKRGAGVITNSEGGVGEDACWGKPAAWCDCSAPATDDFPGGGVALFDHPENFRSARYHARGYGLMAISPFGPQAYSKGKEEASPVEIKEPLRLRYALFVHDGDAQAGGVAAAYQRYVGGE
ncbi:MAG: PmoA family protein [Planctomycetota bacterium]